MATMNVVQAFTVIHTDSHLVVAHKDAGLLTVPAYEEPCMVDLLEAELDRHQFGRFRLAVVHRLDRQTSGLLVFARSPPMAAALAKQFAAHQVEREYIAIVAGRLSEADGTLRYPLAGKRAVTHFKTLTRREDSTVVAVRLETGRRTQIRAHFAEKGHPVIGDTRFKPDRAQHVRWPHARLALHARTLGFVHPASRKPLRFEDPTPVTFKEFLS